MRAALFATVGLIAGCMGEAEPAAVPPPTPGDAGTLATDGGTPPLTVDDAAAKYPDVTVLWARSISRTCGPNNGVCHNSRQFPDMQTVSGLYATIDKRCNQIRDQPDTIDNLCEPPGDILQMDGKQWHIGNVTPQPATGTPTALVVTLDGPAPGAAPSSVAVVRQIPGMSPISLTVPASAITGRSGNSVTLSYATLAAQPGAGPAGSPSTLATFFSPAAFTPGDETQVQLGDPNGDGVFGATLGGALIKPGQPMKSYLFLRLLSPLQVGPGNTNTNVAAMPTIEAQMPIANLQYWDVNNDVVALWCWINGLAADGSNASAPIDYAHCDLSPLPALTAQTGVATTFSSVYQQILQPRCASCHHAGTAYGTTLFMDDLQQTYDVLLQIQGSGPVETQSTGGMPFVTRANPAQSYLYLKITGDPAIGDTARMPLGGQLAQSDIDAIGTWIAQGANND